MKNYIKEDDPFIVPTEDLKLIQEHFGNVSNKYPHCSISQMEIPPRWNEPFQNPEFDEFNKPVNTGVEIKTLKEIAHKLNNPPKDLKFFKKVFFNVKKIILFKTNKVIIHFLILKPLI